MAGDSLGSARIDLIVDVSQFTAAIERSRNLAGTLGEAAAQAFQKSDDRAKRATNSLLAWAQGIGKTAEEQRLLNAAIKGVPVEVLDVVREKILQQRNAADLLVQKERELANLHVFEQQAEEARRLFRGQQAVAAFTEHLDQLEAQERELAAQRGFITTLEQQATAIGKTRSQLLEMKAAELGVAKEAAPFIAKLREQEAALTGATSKFNAYGKSAKEVQLALRGVPAQVTDIFVSLQGGQNPLTVLLQQGGQLRDMFGGIRPAVSAMGNALLNLAKNPILLTTAGFAGLAAMVLKAEQQMHQLDSALILSGQSMVQTSDDLLAMAQQMDSAFDGITTGGAVEAIAEVVRAGNIAIDVQQQVAEAAAKMEVATGKAVKDTVAEFSEIARDPVNAALKLNDSMHFLSEGTIEAAMQFVEMGDRAEAARIISEEYASSLIERSDDVVESLGLVSGAWFNIKEGINETWDASKQFFVDLDRDAKESISGLGKLWESLQLFKAGGPAGAFGFMGNINPPDTAPAEPKKQVDARAVEELQRIQMANQSNLNKQMLEEVRIRNLAARAGWDQVKTNEAVRQSWQKYFDSLPKGKQKSTSPIDNAQMKLDLEEFKSMLAEEQNAIQNRGKILSAEYSAGLVTVQDYYAQQRTMVAQDLAAQEQSLQGQIGVLRTRNATGKDAIDVTRQLSQLETQLARARSDAATQTQVLNIQEQDALRERSQAIDSYKQSLDESTIALSLQYEAAVRGIEIGDREAQEAAAVAAVYAEQAKELRKLALLKQQHPEMAPVYEAEEQALRESTERQVDIVIEGMTRIDAAKGNWLNGVRSAMQNFITETADVASQTAQITTNTIGGFTDMLVDYAAEGKDTWREFLRDIGKQIAKFFIQKAVMEFIAYFAGSFLGGGTTATAGKNFSKSGLTVNAQGGVYSSPSLSAYSNTIVDEPTFFKFAKGGALGVAGEAGRAEAIIPLEKTSNGDLGVKATGLGMGSPQFAFNIVVNQDGSGSADVQAKDASRAYKQLADEMRVVATDTLHKAMLPGGVLYNASGR